MDPTKRRTAMRELVRGRELMTELSSLLEGTSSRVNDKEQSELVGVFYDRVMKAFEVSISLVKSVDTVAAVGSPVLVLQRDDAHCNGSFRRTGTGDPNPRSQIRRRVSDSKTTVTDSPFGDGYQWRKYGQKIIQNIVKYPRSYYKCTHTGCDAKLQVQQIVDSGSLPLYEVIRNNKHTCSTVNLLSAVQDSSSGLPRGAHIITFESGEPVPGFGEGPALSQLASSTTETSARDDDYSVFLPPPSPAGPFYGVDATYYGL